MGGGRVFWFSPRDRSEAPLQRAWHQGARRASAVPRRSQPAARALCPSFVGEIARGRLSKSTWNVLPSSHLPISSSPPSGPSRQGSRGWIRSLCPNSGLLPSLRESLPSGRPMGRKDFSVAFLRSITVLSFIKRICSGGAVCRKKPQLPPCPSWSVFFSGNPAPLHFSPRASVHGVR